MTTKAEDARAMAMAHRENGWPHTDTAEVLEAYADLLDQQAKVEPVGYVYEEPDCDPCFEHVEDRWTKHGAVLWTEMPVYTHSAPAQAEQPSMKVFESHHGDEQCSGCMRSDCNGECMENI